MIGIPTPEQLSEIAQFGEDEVLHLIDEICDEIGQELKNNAKALVIGGMVTFTVGDDNGKWDDNDNYSDKYKVFLYRNDKIIVRLVEKGYSVGRINANDQPMLTIKLKETK